MKLLFNKINYWMEQFYQKRNKVPSNACSRAWLNFFDRIYSDENYASVDQFKTMIEKWGNPDWSNPFPEGMKEHYYYHPQGFIVKYVEYIINEISEPGTIQEDCYNEIGMLLDDQSIIEKGEKRYIQQNQKRNNAIDCFAIMLGKQCLLNRTVLFMNDKDIKLLAINVLLFFDGKKTGYNFNQVFQGAETNAMVDNEDYDMLYKERQKIGQGERETIQYAPEPDQVNKNLPKLDLSKLDNSDKSKTTSTTKKDTDNQITG